MIKKFIDWLQWSSVNPEEVSMTVKSAAISFIPVILIILKMVGVDSIGGADLQMIIDNVGGAITGFLMATSAIFTLISFGRKVYLTFKKPV